MVIGTMQVDDFEFFGVPKENVAAVSRRSGIAGAGGKRLIPNRREVATMPADELTASLIAWMETPHTEVIPSRGQIALVREVLAARDDVAQLGPLMAMCSHYIEGA